MESIKMEPQVFSRQGGVTGIVNKGGESYYYLRDISRSLPAVFKNAVIMSEQVLRETYRDEDELNARLDTQDKLMRLFLTMYGHAKREIHGWVNIMRDITRAARELPHGGEILGNLGSFFMLNTFSYLFTSTQMAIMTPDSLDLPQYTAMYINTAISMMPADLAKSFLSNLKAFGPPFTAPSDLTIVQDSVEDYLDRVTAWQKEDADERARQRT